MKYKIPPGFTGCTGPKLEPYGAGYKKHPAEDFYRGLKDERVSLLASMPRMVSIPYTETKRVKRIDTVEA